MKKGLIIIGIILLVLISSGCISGEVEWGQRGEFINKHNTIKKSIRDTLLLPTNIGSLYPCGDSGYGTEYWENYVNSLADRRNIIRIQIEELKNLGGSVDGTNKVVSLTEYSLDATKPIEPTVREAIKLYKGITCDEIIENDELRWENDKKISKLNDELNVIAKKVYDYQSESEDVLYQLPYEISK